MKKFTAYHTKDPEIIRLGNELGELEDRKPTDSVNRLLVKSLRAKVARLRRS